MLGLITGTLFHAILTTLVLITFAFVMMDGNFTNWGIGIRAAAVTTAGVMNLFGGLIFYEASYRTSHHQKLTQSLQDWIDQ